MHPMMQQNNTGFSQNQAAMLHRQNNATAYNNMQYN
jgi:hypothetical protein